MDRGDWLRTSRGVPVLMYHAFSEDKPSRFVITRRSFARQMRLLALLRYRVVDFEELAGAVRDGDELPRKAAVITIDDGYRDNLEIAQPILSKHGYPATVFVVSGHLGGENDWGDGGAVEGLPLLSPEQVKAMRAAGTAIGAHTRNHVDLSEVEAGLAVEEIEGSRQDLERLLGEPVSSFAYPYGRFDNGAAAAAREAGVLAACTVEGRRASPGGDPLTIPRIEVRGSDSIVRFLRKLWLGGN
jgi:peptidoglycan/xylan/chitin deacetylase (PgdA/CDA1 family)